MQWIKRITNTVYPCRDTQAPMPPYTTIRHGNSKTIARSCANLTALLHGSKLPVSSSLIVISRHYSLATEIKEHIRTNFHLPSPDYKHFPANVFFLMLDPHFSSSLSPKPRPPQPRLKTIPLRSFIPVTHLLIPPLYRPASQTWITSKLLHLTHHSLTSPQYHKHHRTYPSFSFQPSPLSGPTLLFPFSPALCPAHPFSN